MINHKLLSCLGIFLCHVSSLYNNPAQARMCPEPTSPTGLIHMCQDRIRCLHVILHVSALIVPLFYCFVCCAFVSFLSNILYCAFVFYTYVWCLMSYPCTISSWQCRPCDQFSCCACILVHLFSTLLSTSTRYTSRVLWLQRSHIFLCFEDTMQLSLNGSSCWISWNVPLQVLQLAVAKQYSRKF